MNKLYKTLLCIVFALSLSAVQSHDLEKAISSSDRLATNITRDMSRHPHETLTFFGIESNMTVVELSPGGGWYTEILANYIHYPGTLIAAHFNPELGDYYAKSRKKFNKKIDSNPMYGRVELVNLDSELAESNSIDAVTVFPFETVNPIPVSIITLLFAPDTVHAAAVELPSSSITYCLSSCVKLAGFVPVPSLFVHQLVTSSRAVVECE